ncbi:MAG: hypothetical protein GY841_12425 [FCB group bacterium]|nr:hypothetical protein [FCB group bacterium]
MTITTNANFDAKNALAAKTPLYLIKFDSETTDYCNFAPTSPVNSLKKYLKTITGLSQKITPEEGKGSISAINFELIDKDDEITALIATDTDAYFHNKTTTIKAGYLGLAEADLLTIMVGQITSIKRAGQWGGFAFGTTDPQKKLQGKIFKGAEDSTATFSGNPINMLLAWMTSTGAGTNGDYDVYTAGNGLAIDDDEVDVAGIETIRDDYFPVDSHYMSFSITARETASSFFSREIYKPLGLYPSVTGAGKIGLTVYRPPLPTTGTTVELTESNVIGVPTWDANLSALINEIEVQYDYDGSDFLTIDFNSDATSLAARGTANKQLVISSKGFHADSSPKSQVDRATGALARKVKSIFARYATPPIKISVQAWFSRFLAEAGDVLPITHSKLPDIVAGTIGITARNMEVINRSIDWSNGKTKIDLLDTGFAQSTYQVITPTMTVVTGTSATEFEVSAADAAKYENFTLPEVSLKNAMMLEKVAAVTITDITGTTVTVDSLGSTPSTGDIITFADYGSATTEQKQWGYIAAASDKVGGRGFSVEDLATDYTSVSLLSSYTTIITAKIIWTDLVYGVPFSMVYSRRDFGTDYFDGYIRLRFNTQLTSDPANGSPVCLLMFSNTTSDYVSAVAGASARIGLLWNEEAGVHKIRLFDKFGGESSASLSLSTDYYVEFVRDETVGANGTIYAYIYSDTGFSVLVDTLSVALAAKDDFRYFAFVTTATTDVSVQSSGFAENPRFLLEGAPDIIGDDAHLIIP